MTRDEIIKFMEYLKEEIPKAGQKDRQCTHCTECTFLNFNASKHTEMTFVHCGWYGHPATNWDGLLLADTDDLTKIQYSIQCVWLSDNGLSLLKTYNYLRQLLKMEKFNDVK